MSVIEIRSMAEFNEQVECSTAKLVVVDFYATWCGPCKVVAPKVASFAREPVFADVAFYKVDVDAVPAVAQACTITAMPTFKLYRRGNVVSEIIGADPTALKKAIEGALAAA